MQVRLMCEADRPAVAALEACCFAEPWSAEALTLFDGVRGFGVVAVWKEQVIAYGTVQLAPGEGMIVNVATHPDFRRQGAARAVMQEIVRLSADRYALEQLSLEVRVSNTAAQALYVALGFCTAGVRRHFYSHPVEDALVMVKTF